VKRHILKATHQAPEHDIAGYTQNDPTWGWGRITGLGQSLLSMTALFNVTPPPTGKQSILMSVCVFLSVRDHIFRTIHPIFTKLFVDVTYGHTYDIHMAVAQSSSGSLVICYIFPVSWMTSYVT